MTALEFLGPTILVQTTNHSDTHADGTDLTPLKHAHSYDSMVYIKCA